MQSKKTLEHRLFVSIFSMTVVILTITSFLNLTVNVSKQRRLIDSRILETAGYVAGLDGVKDSLKKGYPNNQVQEELDSYTTSFSDITMVSVYDPDGLRFYHTARQYSGETYVDGEEVDILQGKSPYVRIGYSTNGMQRRAFHAIYSRENTIIGYVVASVLTNYVRDQVRTLWKSYILIVFGMAILSMILTRLILVVLRNSFQGLHPMELLDLYEHQGAVLNALDEGLLASDFSGRILYANGRAEKLLGKNKLKGYYLNDVYPESHYQKVMSSGEGIIRRPENWEEHRLLVTELPILDGSDLQGVLTILQDRTEMEKMSDELSGARSMLDTLRAFNHEFLNKLHIILGYLQTGETDKAMTFIMNSNLVSSQSIRQTADCLRESRICALVIGKMMYAAERGILLRVTPDSHVTDRDILLPIEHYTTVIGNLLENAIEELMAMDSELKEINLGLYFDKQGSVITCQDTGRGIPEALLGRITEKGVSGKGEGRGMGLFLINNICFEWDGAMEVETEAGEGTCITITFTAKSERRGKA